MSPVHPVTEGDSVNLVCTLGTEELLSNVTFYKNNELVRNDYSEELNISEVSESDEGFYRCEYSGVMSPESWMSVKCEYDRLLFLYDGLSPRIIMFLKGHYLN